MQQSQDSKNASKNDHWSVTQSKEETGENQKRRHEKADWRRLSECRACVWRFIDQKWSVDDCTVRASSLFNWDKVASELKKSWQLCWLIRLTSYESRIKQTITRQRQEVKQLHNQWAEKMKKSEEKKNEVWEKDSIYVHKKATRNNAHMLFSIRKTSNSAEWTLTRLLHFVNYLIKR